MEKSHIFMKKSFLLLKNRFLLLQNFFMCAIMFTERKIFMDSICRFLPLKSVSGNIKMVHFVYETEFLLMKQPFIEPIYYLHLVTSGNAVLKFSGKQYPLKEGTLFFFFSGVPYELMVMKISGMYT